MFLINPILAIIHNVATDRFHPVVFEENPLPGPPSPDKPVRHKTKMHHTGGFDTREEALASIENDLKARLECSNVRTETDFEWDGEGIPAMVHFFG